MAGLCPDQQAPRRRADDVVVIRPRRYETIDELDADIARGIAGLSELQAIEHEWTEFTEPIRFEIRTVEAALQATHRRGSIGERVAMNFSAEAKIERAVLFGHLDLARENAKIGLAEYHRARSIVRDARKELDGLQTLRKHFRAPRPSPALPTTLQGSLFA